MNTNELVDLLARDAGPVESNATARRFATALGWGIFGATLLMAVILGVRRDLHEAMFLPMFWLKLIFPIIAAFAALYAATRLARPGMRIGHAPAVLVTLLLTLWLAGAVALMQARPEERDYLIFGHYWSVCPVSITLLSIPIFAASMWAMKGLAATRPALAGGAAGLLAGSAGAAVYALHCVEMAAPFLAIWYVIGITIPTTAGVLLGSRILRW